MDIKSVKSGMGFGITSGVITTLGLLIGLGLGTHSKIAVIGGVITIALSDALSDSLGVHISQESRNTYSQKQIWTSTISTFIFKFFISTSFLVPVLLFSLNTALVINVIYGMIILISYSVYLAREQRIPAHHVILEHLTIALMVVIGSFIGGRIISNSLPGFTPTG